MSLSISLSLAFQEVSFYEDGEPILDGDPGDLKVSLFPNFPGSLISFMFKIRELTVPVYLAVPNQNSTTCPVQERWQRSTHERQHYTGKQIPQRSFLCHKPTTYLFTDST